MRLIHAIDATIQPAMRELHAFLCIAMITWIWWAFIKCHYDIGPDATLNIDHIFRSEFVPASVDMTLKTHSFFFYFSIGGERKNLVASTVGENGFIPIHETMQTTCLLQHFSPRPQIQMIS